MEDSSLRQGITAAHWAGQFTVEKVTEQKRKAQAQSSRRSKHWRWFHPRTGAERGCPSRCRFEIASSRKIHEVSHCRSRCGWDSRAPRPRRYFVVGETLREGDPSVFSQVFQQKESHRSVLQELWVMI